MRWPGEPPLNCGFASKAVLALPIPALFASNSRGWVGYRREATARFRWGTFTLSKRRVPDDLFRSWIHPLRHNRKTCCDLNKYLRIVPKPEHLLEWADHQRIFASPVLIIWARDDKLMPPAHAERLAQHFQNTRLVWIDDSRTLISIDQPKTLTDHLHTFLTAHT